jgi:hypothetical protein
LRSDKKCSRTAVYAPLFWLSAPCAWARYKLLNSLYRQFLDSLRLKSARFKASLANFLMI